MTGDRPTAEDLVQDAFLGLHRHWDKLVDPGKALSYVRSCVLNGCREIHRVKYRTAKFRLDPPEDIESAEDIAILGEANRAVLAAIRRLPARPDEPSGKPARILYEHPGCATTPRLTCCGQTPRPAPLSAR
jgi:DNA-directed RNA polymerase specialized sigma24 family protein